MQSAWEEKEIELGLILLNLPQTLQLSNNQVVSSAKLLGDFSLENLGI